MWCQRDVVHSAGRTTSQSGIEKGFRAPSILNEVSIDLSRREETLLKLGPKYIPNNLHIAHKRMENEIQVGGKKIGKVFVERGWVVPKQRLQIFTDSLVKVLTDCHDSHPPSV